MAFHKHADSAENRDRQINMDPDGWVVKPARIFIPKI